MTETEPKTDESQALLDAAETQEVGVSLIDRDVPNARQPDEKRIEELAASIGRDGLLNPITIFAQPDGADRYTIAAGFMRLDAVMKLGRETIPARVVPAEHYSLSAIRRIMAIENLDRSDLTPAEEAAALDALVKSIEDDIKAGVSGGVASEIYDSALQTAADKIGRTKQYVQGRLNLLRLSAKCRKMLASGAMLLGHALQIAKLVDHKRQDEIAGQIRWDPDGTRCYTSAGEIRAMVAREITSLRGTPWRLDTPFRIAKPLCGWRWWTSVSRRWRWSTA